MINTTMSFNDYLKHPALSRSKLMRILKSKWHYQNDSVKPSLEMALGSYVHERILTPDIESFIVEPVCDRRTKAGKEEYNFFVGERDAKGLQSISQEQSHRADGMIEAFKNHSLCSSVIDMCEHKESTVIHSYNGLQCKSRFDLLSVDNTLVADIKTTRDASPEGFAKSVANFYYHAQAAFYLDMASLELGKKFDDFLIIAIESTEPYGIGVYWLDDDAINMGRRLVEEAINRVKNVDSLPRVYDEIITTLDLPTWAYYRDGDKNDENI